MKKDRRIGKFYVDFPNVEIRKIASILSKMLFIPLRVEALYYGDRFEYIGTSPLFDKIDIGEKIPLYDIIVNDFTDDVSVNRIEGK